MPEVSGPGVGELEPIRSAVAQAVAEQAALSGSWWAVGSDDAPAPAPAAESAVPATGSFGGFGVDRRVALVDDPGAPVGHLPTAMLVAGWVRELATRRPAVTPVVVTPGADGDQCSRRGAQLAAEIAAAPGDAALLVVGDGAIHLSERAPGGGREPAAVELQEQIDAALASGDPAALRALPVESCDRWGASGWAPWQVAAACAPGPATVRVGYSGAPFGVGYNVVTWRFR
ncbi:hypothetical protein nbrc107697_22030 [Gordonia crocea]|uniref:Uncharacterized protein n=1 Tax=Gordonia crocea TaxID=589162 RepID=A0A7I9UY85_9ACTN|nr:hypothetical protein nbrc107697_22030 [Gordonia crocea]